MRRTALSLASLAFLAGCLPLFSQEAKPAAHMRGAFRKPQQNGWIYVHLEGPPFDLGFQHGYLLAPEIQDAVKVEILETTHGGTHDWNFYRNAAQNVLWPHIEKEYRDELLGISEGLTLFANGPTTSRNMTASIALPPRPRSRCPTVAARLWPRVVTRRMARSSLPITIGPATWKASVGPSSLTSCPQAAIAF